MKYFVTCCIVIVYHYQQNLDLNKCWCNKRIKQIKAIAKVKVFLFSFYYRIKVRLYIWACRIVHRQIFTQRPSRFVLYTGRTLLCDKQIYAVQYNIMPFFLPVNISVLFYHSTNAYNSVFLILVLDSWVVLVSWERYCCERVRGRSNNWWRLHYEWKAA